MKSKINTESLLIIVFFITFINLIYNSPIIAQTIINDGYGDFMLVPAGEFLMGDNTNEGYFSERPVHTVYVDSFYIGKYEMTNGEFKKFIDDGGYEDSIYWTGGGFGKYGTHPQYWNTSTHRGGGIPENEMFPVVGVCRYEAEAYCVWLSAKTGWKYRLPTEAEWEKAARGTDQRLYAWGNNLDSTYANYYKSNDPYEDSQGPLGGFTPVGFYNGDSYGDFSTHNNASPYGVYDMTGNVFEWCSDWYDENYYANSPENNPAGPSIGKYVPYGSTEPTTGYFPTIRGGFWTDNSWNMVIRTLGTASRSYIPEGPGKRKSRLGFRCVREQYEYKPFTVIKHINLNPGDCYLFPNYPNPFNQTTRITYTLHKPSNVRLQIYNLSGQALETLIDGFQRAGEHEIIWQPKGLPSGIYYYRLLAGKYSETIKIILQK
ncbi:SUMF1/EgtB/PvdO family nonheme iron enzyme [Bacteroidota bacterium]